ncbi:MAG: histidinol dehydrogenase [Candidatus Korobacteraceae bacterium]
MRILEGKKAELLVRSREQRGMAGLDEVEPQVRRIVNDVRKNGERALRRYAEKWDGIGKRQPIAVSEAEMQQAWDEAAPEFRAALERAAENIRRFCEWQKPSDWTREAAPGVCIGQIVRPIGSVGCYVPGGRYPLPSTMLMTVIPAQVAGVSRIQVVSPRPARETLAAAAFLGVRDFYRIGGAQAIVALALGTDSVPKVQKIVGPGNKYVTAAKRIVAADCAIDMLAGPTEVVIVAESGNPAFIASDLVAQAEHDPDASAIFITSSRKLARDVAAETVKQAKRNKIAAASLKRNGAVLLLPTREAAIEAANRVAAEHLTIEADILREIQNAGSVFIGDWSPQAAGDYASGPNHVLPTGGAARFRGGLSVLDFVKLISVQELSASGLRSLAPAITTLAEAEGLSAHAASIRVRCGNA